MKVMRITPNSDRIRLEDEVDRLFSHSFPGLLAPVPPAGWFPAVDLHESAQDYTVRMDLPGVNPKDVKVQMIEGRLTIKGERVATPVEGEKAKAHRVERAHGSFERVFKLPARVEPGKVTAKYQDGVLEVRVPKAPEGRTQDIEIEVA